SRLQVKSHKKRQRRPLYNDIWVNSVSGLNNFIHTHIQYWNSQIHKANINGSKGEIDCNTIIVEDFNISLLVMNRSSRQKISKETSELNYTLDQMDLSDVYRTFHPSAAEYTIFL
uniref:Uncharacterized protein n=1 Tax=Macaca mulatta TaxID=9544 RepID=A0A5F7ZYN4_MACMU